MKMQSKNRFAVCTKAAEAQSEATKRAGLEDLELQRQDAMERNTQMALPDASWQKLRKEMPKPDDHKDCEWLREQFERQKFIRTNTGARSPSPPNPVEDHTIVQILRRHQRETRFALAWVWVKHNEADDPPPPGALAKPTWRFTGAAGGVGSGAQNTGMWYALRLRFPSLRSSGMVEKTPPARNFTCGTYACAKIPIRSLAQGRQRELGTY